MTRALMLACLLGAFVAACRTDRPADPALVLGDDLADLLDHVVRAPGHRSRAFQEIGEPRGLREDHREILALRRSQRG